MQNKKTLLILILIFVLLIGGATVLYQQLGATVATEQLAVYASPQLEEAPAEEPKQENAPAEEPKQENAPAEEPKQENAPAEEPKQENAPAEEPKQENAPAEEPRYPMAPDFIVYDTEGNEVRMSDFLGKPIVLNFWASWCYPCQIEMPDFHQTYLEQKDDVQFLMINRTDGGRETMETAIEFLEENEYTFPVFYDLQTYAAAAFGAYSMPATFFIDAEGYVVAHASGALNTEMLQVGLDMIM